MQSFLILISPARLRDFYWKVTLCAMFQIKTKTLLRSSLFDVHDICTFKTHPSNAKKDKNTKKGEINGNSMNSKTHTSSEL